MFCCSNKKNLETHLVVDDSTLNRMVIRKLLEKQNIGADEASNGQEAIGLIKNNKYRIIWMDIKMPRMNGIQLTEHLRENLKYEGIIIGVTGCIDQTSKDNYVRIGMNGMIAKPIDKEDLHYYIKKYRDSI